MSSNACLSSAATQRGFTCLWIKTHKYVFIFLFVIRDFNTISAVDYNIVMFFIQAIADFPTANNGLHAIIH